MRLSDGMIWALECDQGSGVEVYCKNDKEETAKRFQEIFAEQWKQALDAVEEECDYFDENGKSVLPAEVTIRDFGFLVCLEPLYIEYNEGYNCDIERGPDALAESMRLLHNEFPDVSYIGYIAFPWSDMHGGDVVSFMVYSADMEKQKNAILDYIGEKFRDLCRFVPQKHDTHDYIGEAFWDKLQQELESSDADGYFAVADDFIEYRKWIGKENLLNVLHFVLSVAEKECEEAKEGLERRIGKLQALSF